MADRKPRVGFLGVGWIGRSRMQAIADTSLVEIVAIAEPDPAALAAALLIAPGATPAATLLISALLDRPLGSAAVRPIAAVALEGIALDRGAAVFCQKPLGRTSAEVRTVLDVAERADRLLGVDMSYRFTEAALAMRRQVRDGAIGSVFAADLVFHNAYGPDKAWFRDRALSGGGCVMDLGVHLVDLALWTLDFPAVAHVSSALFAGGERLEPGSMQVEDYAVATLTLEGGAVVRLACSWNLPAGCDAVITADFWGSRGGLAIHNVAGSFFDFEAARHDGARTVETLAKPPDAWSGRAAAQWACELATDTRFVPGSLHRAYEVLDKIYLQQGS